MKEEVTEYKKLNIYRRPSVAEKEAVIKVTGAKDIRMEYGMHVFTGQDFRNMTSLTVWGIRTTPKGMDWIDAKRILTVMSILGNHFVTVEIFLHEGLINVYDCNLVVTENDKFFTLIQSVFELLPKLLKQSGIMNHMPEKLLTQP
ncbi:hypothetical protein EJD97_023871 [Solanum chilense]|uniref:Uncharacterized protein n=1 Tax=Solanum chilense TaxID=4083 RepID=A0A6N2C3D4_SOLCI|nr:hypothetical protein EJD97_023871 [Solanum chilense]